MCSASPPKAPQPPPPAPRLVDEAILAQRTKGRDTFSRGGFLGTITKRGGTTGAAGIPSGTANAITANLLGAG